MLSEVANSREALRDRGSSIYRSSSSPRISALLDNKDKVRFRQGRWGGGVVCVSGQVPSVKIQSQEQMKVCSSP